MNSKVILIIDDDETIKEGLNIVFEAEGYQVFNLASGENLWKWLEDNDPNLILIDYLMPGKNGGELTKELRQFPKTASVPIIMLAATIAYRKQGYEAGINKFFVKPFELEDVLRQVRYYLK